jgi:hypothetical protein
MKSSENKKERTGLLLSIGLGILAGLLTAASFYGAPFTFLIFSVLNPLILTLIAPARRTALSILSNLVLVFSLPIIVWLVLLILRVPWTGPVRGGYGELVTGFLLALGVAITLGWATSALVNLVRRKMNAGQNANPDTSV